MAQTPMEISPGQGDSRSASITETAASVIIEITLAGDFNDAGDIQPADYHAHGDGRQ